MPEKTTDKGPTLNVVIPDANNPTGGLLPQDLNAWLWENEKVKNLGTEGKHGLLENIRVVVQVDIDGIACEIKAKVNKINIIWQDANTLVVATNLKQLIDMERAKIIALEASALDALTEPDAEEQPTREFNLEDIKKSHPPAHDTGPISEVETKIESGKDKKKKKKGPLTIAEAGGKLPDDESETSTSAADAAIRRRLNQGGRYKG